MLDDSVLVLVVVGTDVVDVVVEELEVVDAVGVVLVVGLLVVVVVVVGAVVTVVLLVLTAEIFSHGPQVSAPGSLPCVHHLDFQIIPL